MTVTSIAFMTPEEILNVETHAFLSVIEFFFLI